MSILVDNTTRVIVQGITGSEGSFHTREMLAYGTKIVAGVTPGKGGETFSGDVPIFNTVQQATQASNAEASVIFVPSQFASDAILEAIDAGLKLVVCITEGIAVMDMLAVYQAVKDNNVTLIGPNCPGIISPGKCKIGIMPGFIHTPGPVGVVSRSGTLTYEAVHQLTELGIGQSTCIGIGGDPIIGTRFTDVLRHFDGGKDTRAVVMIGEIGGTAEEEAATFVRDEMSKPVIAFIAGQTAPTGRRMGHAGAIISGGKGTATEKIDTLKACGVHVSASPADIGNTVQKILKQG
ncbi:succinate--CoA ligase subunit alpha [candidate division KSB1 bacterium]|nr:succinate--CoA ligase subunit alpha [candidate division KSB1 bacterium]